MANLNIQNGKIYLQYRVLGKRKSIKTNLDATEENIKKAEAMKRDIERKVEIKKKDIKFRDLISGIENKNSIKDITIEKAVDIYKYKLALTSKSYQYRFDVAMMHFYKIVPANQKISKVTYEHSLRFVKFLMDRKLSNASVRSYYDHLKVLFLFLVKQNHLEKCPFNTEVLPRKTKKAIIPFEEKMLKEILMVAQESDKMFYNILSMLLLTGIRPKDLLNLKVGDINFVRKKIYIRISKTNKEINIPMSQSLYRFISENMKFIMDLDGEQLIFNDYTVARVGRRFRRLKSKLGIKEKFVFTLKTFRKTFATHYAKFLPIQDVARLLGHDEVETTIAYYADTNVENIRNKMDEFDGKQNKLNN